MKQPFEFFDAIYCINLDSRADRWRAVQDEFGKLGIRASVIRFPALVPPTGGPSILGCGMSHREVIRRAQREGQRSILVLEDDVRFVNHPLDILSQALRQLRALTWDVLYLGATTHEPLEKVDTNLVRIRECHASHAICYNARVFDFILRNFNLKEYHYDIWLRHVLQKEFTCLGTNPLISTQSAGYSDIRQAVVDYAFIEANYNINTAHIKEE